MRRKPWKISVAPNPERRRAEKLEQLAQLEAAQDELKRSSDAFTERVQQLSAKLQLVGRQIADMEAKQRTLDDALRRRQLLPADLPFGTPFMEPIDDSMDNLLPLLNDYQDSWQGCSAWTTRSKRCTPRCASRAWPSSTAKTTWSAACNC
jgi:DNA repair exonuclease SbcCD ATPase subunit